MIILVRIVLIYLLIGCAFGFLIATVLKEFPNVVNNVKDKTMNVIYINTILRWPIYLVGTIKRSIIHKELRSDQEINNALLELQDILDEEK